MKLHFKGTVDKTVDIKRCCRVKGSVWGTVYKAAESKRCGRVKLHVEHTVQ